MNPFSDPDFHNKNLSDEKYIEEHDIHQTGVCKETIDPIWNETIIFPCPLDNIASISDLINTNVFIAIKDYDSDENGVDFDSLGCVQFSFTDIVMNGKTTSRKINAIIDNGRTHMIQNDSNMTVKGTLGKIKINLSFIFEEDAMNLFKAYPAFDRRDKQVVSFDAFYYNLMSKLDPTKDMGNTFKRSSADCCQFRALTSIDRYDALHAFKCIVTNRGQLWKQPKPDGRFCILA